jgi:replication initiation and membrane attachment protein DnaB
VETVAAQWCRLNIETVEDAMAVAEKEHKKIKKLMDKTTTNKASNKNTNNKEELPSWFEENIEKQEISPEEQEELNNLLKDF